MKEGALLVEFEEGSESASDGVLEVVPLKFEENLVESMADCPDYGCTCISHEKCCGCIFQ